MTVASIVGHERLCLARMIRRVGRRRARPRTAAVLKA
jgi:hypothetical protein